MYVNKTVNELESRNKFMELFFVTFYTANSLMKLEYWDKNLTVDKASDVYSRLIKEYMGIGNTRRILATASYSSRINNVCSKLLAFCCKSS